MKKLGVYSALAVSALCFLSWLSPLKAYASTVKLTFDGTTYDGKGGNSLGGFATYPYYFTIGTASTEVPLLCVSFQDHITQWESWTADVDPIGTTGLALDKAQQEEDAWLDSQLSGANQLTTEELQWAAWVVGDSSLTTWKLENIYGLSGSVVGSIDSDITDAANYVAAHPNASSYAGYQLYVPKSDDDCDYTPQTFIGPAPTPEPSSLVLLGSGLLAAAGALYRRKKQLTT